MLHFNGFGDWIEIFRGGKQADSEGREHDGDALIERAVTGFNAAEHEPPIVIGHPKDNAPAYGWVEGLRSSVKDGVKVLLMKAREVVPEFEDMVRRGLFKKRSASFYPDGRLRHVGFLGAAPPAVKGLADLKFEAGEEVISFIGGLSHHYQKADQGGEKMDKFKEFLEFLAFWKKAEKDGLIPGAEASAAGAGAQGAQYTEADLAARIEAAKKEAADKAKAEAQAEFAEAQKKNRIEARKAEIAGWINQGVKDGKILPAWKDGGIVAFMEGLEAEETIQFAEGVAAKMTPVEWFKGFLGQFSASPLFKEFATKGAVGAQFAEAKAQADLGKRIADKVNPKSSDE